MNFLIGTDEAGYGPNLGPLVISATVWQVPDDLLNADLYDSLSDAVRRPGDTNGHPSAVVIGDSKRLYRPAGGLAELELGVLSALHVAGQPIRCWREIWQRLDPQSAGQQAVAPWYDEYDLPLPVDAAQHEIDAATATFRSTLLRTAVRLTAIRSRVVLPERFNDLVDQLGNKATVLSTLTLQLVSELLETCRAERVLVQCDKHGGRNNYARLLQRSFPDYLVEIHGESRELSVYRWGPAHRRVEFRFAKGGESFLPSALASMTSKYLREIAMRAFNTFWQQQVPGLKPTAGYPVDAKRFKADIAAAQQRLEVDDQVLWRKR